MEHLVKIENLRKTYGDFSLSIDELTVSSGCITGLIGPNGAGKTSTIKALLGVIQPDGGTLELLGSSTADTHSLTNAKRRVGVAMDTCPFPTDLTVREVSLLGRALYENWDQRAFETLSAQFELLPDKKVSELSRGMGMKLQLAFALSYDPDLLILDEPTAGLDPLARLDVLDLLRKRTIEGRGALVSTHITSDLEKIADYVVCINDGNVLFSEDIDVICDQSGVLKCRASELEAVCSAGIFEEGTLRVMREPYATIALVPDRFTLARAFPSLACERSTVESYMTFMMKGEQR